MAKQMKRTTTNNVSNTTVKEQVDAVKTFDPSEGILCRSLTKGGLYIEGVKTGILYEFDDYGDETEIEYRDLIAMVRARSPRIFKSNFIILDKDFISENSQVKRFYENNYNLIELENILDLPTDEMIAEIDNLPDGAKESIKNIAASKISDGVLDSVKKIKALDDYYNTKLMLLSDFAD